MRKYILVIFIAITGVSYIGACTSASRSLNDAKGSKQIYSYNEREIIEEFYYLGNWNLLSESYRVYNCFKSIKVAQDYRGQSLILFLSKHDTLVYILDSKSDLPDSLVDRKFYLNGASIQIDELTNPLCLNTGCFDKENEYKSIVLSIDSLR